MTRQLLVINPNTSASVTGLLRTHVQRTLGEGVEVTTATARLGAAYISDEASYAVAGHALLDAWAAALAGGARPDAVLVGCFGDPGLLALRDSSPVPVTGLAEAAFTEAARHGSFAVVTGGAAWPPMLKRLAQALGLGDTLVDVLAVAPTGAQLAQDRDGAVALLADACVQAAALPGVRAVILGGAGLAGLAALVQPSVPVPVIDSVEAGARLAFSGAAGGRTAPGLDGSWTGIAPELSALSPATGLGPAALVDEFLRLLMIPDPQAASAFTAPDLRIRFTGKRLMTQPAQAAAFNAGRYAWVKKRFERTEVVAGGTPESTVVYSLGTLYGAWPDGTPFEGNRYVDRYIVRQGRITEMDVWNDSAEWLLVRAGLATIDT